MRINQLVINHFRAFEKVTIDFPESNTCVFIGTNGKGKSSLLDLTAMFLNSYLFGFLKTQLNDLELSIDDINFKSKKTFNQCVLLINTEGGEETLSLDREISFENKYPFFSQDTIQTFEEEKSQKGNINIPTLIYYTDKRTSANNYTFDLETPKSSIDFPQIAVYENAFSTDSFNFQGFINWFRLQEDIENELVRKERNFDLKNPLLEVVRNAIAIFFNTISPEAHYKNLRIERNPQTEGFFKRFDAQGSLVVSKGGNDLKINQLSSGEKMLLLLIADIARRLSIANPLRSNPLEGEGIVLIDEIELHLHPRWQRNIIPALNKTFPNIQFIVTTHSPQVLSNVHKNDIRVIDDGKIFGLSSDPFGRDTNAILEEIMDDSRRPRDRQEKIEAYFRAINQRQFDKLAAIRTELETLIANDDPIFMQADSLINRLTAYSR